MPDTPATPGRLPVASHAALTLGRAAARLSQWGGHGRGSQVGGKVAYRLRPQTLADLAAHRSVALVSGTNGKSTTATLLAAAASMLGPVAFNRTGANMEEGLVTALDADRRAAVAVLETDEAYLSSVVEATRPRLIVLMNLSRDFLERGVRAKRLAGHWHDTVTRIDWPCTVVANVDDPLVAWAVAKAPRVIWVAGEDTYLDDAVLCRDCLVRLDRDGWKWACPRCRFSRHEPHWMLHREGGEVSAQAPNGAVVGVPRALPGHAAEVNVLFALAAAVELGVPVESAAARIAEVEGVDGRYAPRPFGAHRVRVLLAKNPASWTESLATVSEGPAGSASRSLVLAMHGRGGGGGQDTAMLWDAPFERLAGRRVTVAGSRGNELALRLTVAGVHVDVGGDDVLGAVGTLPPGDVDLVANWPAFNDVLDVLGRDIQVGP
ncbi:MAG: MurT ligase domain-containing protein [Actinomycetes bacterium]